MTEAVVPQPGADPNEPHIVNYVPDEVCLVVRAPEFEDLAAFYEHVRMRLNSQITTLLKSESPERLTPFEADLQPTILRQRFSGDRAVLQPLRRSAVRRDPQAPPINPWVTFRRARSGQVTHHLYFQLGRQRQRLDRIDLNDLRLGLQSVRELVLLLNRTALSLRQQPFGESPWVLQAVAPNWVTLALQMGCGCPAGLPIPAGPERHRWHFRFRGPLREALERPPVGPVMLAVLDTCPTQEDLDKAAARFGHNSLLGDVQRSVKMDAPSLVPTASLGAHLAGCLPRWQWDMQNGPAHTQPERFAMPDHGLFVTGIVVDIVRPDTPVHLIRVLNDYGVGDLFAITRALAQLPRALLGSDEPRPDEPRLVVNLSLAIDLPIPNRLLERWLPRTSQDPQMLHTHLPDVSGTFNMLHANLADVIGWLTERGVLVVAATGNDGLRKDVSPGDPPPPRFPARYDDVLAVAATRRDLHTPADYSNRGDLSSGSWPGDVATFGGNVVPAAAPDQPGVSEADDSIVGIFSNRALPGGDRNTTGWVRWSGTSFAAPIASAVAARLWSADPSLTPADLTAFLHHFAHHPHGGADPDSPLEVPVLDVTQR